MRQRPSPRDVKYFGLVLASAFVACVIAIHTTGAAGPAAASARSARVGTLRFSYPDRFAHLAVPHGALIADYPVSLNSPTVRRAVFPSTGALFMLSREPRLQPPIAAPAVAFPLSLARLGTSHQRPNGRTWQLRFSVKDAVYWVTMWFGKNSSVRDRAAIAAVTSSIRTS